jgi:hypothetical protein
VIDTLLPLKACLVLQQELQSGKQAIKGEHRKLFSSAIQHSIDFEQAAQQWHAKAQLKRLDYLVQSKRKKGWAAVEVHQAKSSDVIQKKQDSTFILNKHCPSMLKAIEDWFVCIEGDIHHTHKRKINDAGIQIVRNLLHKL